MFAESSFEVSDASHNAHLVISRSKVDDCILYANVSRASRILRDLTSLLRRLIFFSNTRLDVTHTSRADPPGQWPDIQPFQSASRILRASSLLKLKPHVRLQRLARRSLVAQSSGSQSPLIFPASCIPTRKLQISGELFRKFRSQLCLAKNKGRPFKPTTLPFSAYLVISA